MRFIIQVLFITILASVFELFLPWWTIAIASLIGGYFFTTRYNFIAGFLSIAVLWVITSVIIDISASAPLADRVAAIFSLNKTLLFVVTALIGGLVGGFACMAGGALRKQQKPARSY